MKRVIIASTNRVTTSFEDSSITLSADHDREVVVTQVSPTNCHVYFYYNGAPSKATSRSFYESLYSQGVIDDVDTRSGFVDTTLSADEVIKLLKNKGYSQLSGINASTSGSKQHVIELNCVNESDMVSNTSPLEYIEDWESYYEEILDGSLDDVWFDLSDIDQSLYIIDDGGEMIRLKDGTIVNIVFRGDSCHVWEEDDEESIEYIDYLLKTYG